MRIHTTIWLAATIFAVEAFSVNVWASGRIKRTVHEVKELSQALAYELSEENPPAITPDGWVHRQALTYEWQFSTNKNGYFVDWWGEPLICRHPGKHSKYDVYSTGANLTDDAGKGDDLATWSGVNEGYYYKKDWPTARRWAAGSFVAGIVCLIVMIRYKGRLWLATVPWIFGTLWGARNVDVIVRSSTSEIAPSEIVIAFLAVVLTTCVILSIGANRSVRWMICKIRG